MLQFYLNAEDVVNSCILLEHDLGGLNVVPGLCLYSMGTQPALSHSWIKTQQQIAFDGLCHLRKAAKTANTSSHGVGLAPSSAHGWIRVRCSELMDKELKSVTSYASLGF